MNIEVPEKAIDLIYELYDLVEPQILTQGDDLKHSYSLGFDHGQQNVKDVLEMFLELVKRLCESVDGDCYRGGEWEKNQVAEIRRIMKGLK